MFDYSVIEETAKRIVREIPATIQPLTQEFRQYTGYILSECLLQLNLVTREEFDAQSRVLAKTRAKLEELEKRIALIETNLKNSNIIP